MTRLCVPLSPRTTQDCCDKLRSLESRCDLFEIRADAFQEDPDIERIFRTSRRPLIWTHRNTDEGGADNPRQSRRLEEYRLALQHGAEWVDVEWRSGLAQQLAAGDKTVLSFHDFENTPAEIQTIIRNMAGIPRGIVKVATRVRRTSDLLALAQGARWLNERSRKQVVFGMGSDGKPLRLLAPQIGAEWTYVALDTPTADGQLTAADLQTYRLGQVGRSARIFAVIGNPIGHSLSPSFHNAAYSALRLNAVYVSIRVDDLTSFINLARELGLSGWSVTLPWKTEMAHACELQDTASQRSGAVNTVRREVNRLLGWNTDWHGFLQPLRSRLTLKGLDVTVLGAGGVARSAVAALKSVGANVTVLARRIEPLREFERDFSVNTGLFHEDPEIRGDLIVNTTPVGMSPAAQEMLVPAATLERFRVAYDLVYTPRETMFLRQSAQMGLQTISGWEMFVHQAAEQVRIFTGQDLPSDWLQNQLRS